jgi:hypothetical protein
MKKIIVEKLLSDLATKTRGAFVLQAVMINGYLSITDAFCEDLLLATTANEK